MRFRGRSPSQPQPTLGASHLFAVYAILIPSWEFSIIDLVMLKGAFSKLTVYAGLAAGIVGLVAVVGPFVLSALKASAIARFCAHHGLGSC